MKGKSIVKKILTTGVAAAMVVTMSGMPVWAATLANGVTAISADDGAKIEKTLKEAAQGVDVPTATFKFGFTPYAVTSTVGTVTATTGVKAGPTKDTVQITSGTSSIAGTYDIQIINGSAKTGKIFAASEFNGDSYGPGIYGYLVQETETGFTNTSDKILTKDNTVYYVEVKVINEDGTLKIAGVTARPATVENGVVTALGEKIPGTDNSKTGTEDGIPFENDYAEYAHNTPGGGDDTTANTSEGLKITKKTSGTGFKSDQKFTYSITFTEDKTEVKGSTETNKKYVNDVLDITSGSAVYTAKKADNSDVDGTATTANTKLSYDTTYYFTLTKDGNISFKLPAGTSYEVEEIGNGGATSVTSAIITNGTSSTGAAKVSSYVGAKNNTVTYTNTNDGNPLTGIINNYGSLIAVVAIAAGGIVVLTLRRRREDI